MKTLNKKIAKAIDMAITEITEAKKQAESEIL